MSKQQQKAGVKAPKWERLRALRLSEEESRKRSGTWGELMVGEIEHADSASVYVNVWKGNGRPDPVKALTARGAGVSAADWPALMAWKGSYDPESFQWRILGWNLSEDEAHKLMDARIATHRAAGLAVVKTNEV